MDLLFNTETICDNDLDRLRSHRFLCACVKNVLHRAFKYHKHGGGGGGDNVFFV